MSSGQGDVFGVFRVGDRLIGVPIDNLAEVCAVPAVSRLITSAEAILGAFDLRGNMVPLVDSLALMGGGSFQGPVRKAALIQFSGRIVAIALDEVVNLFEATMTVPPSRIERQEQTSAQCDAAVRDMFAGGFVMDGAIVSCIDVEALLTRTAAIAVEHMRNSSRGAELLHRSKFLVFASGGAKFAVETEYVWGTVPKCRLDPENLSVDQGPFMGFIRHIGTKIPVVDTNMVLGIGHSSRCEEAEVVALRLSDERLIGLHVDATERVMPIGRDQRERTSALLSRNTLLNEVFIEDSDTQVFLVDHPSLSALDEIVSISQLVSSESDPVAAKDNGRGPVGDAAQAQMTSYLVFEAGSKKAVPARQVIRIIKKPARIIPARNVPPKVEGFFAYGSASVPIVALDRRAAHADAEYVLLVSHRGEQIGFLATEICGVRTPEKQYPGAKAKTGEPTLLQLKEEGNKGLVPLVDLEQMAEAILSAVGADAVPV